MTARLATAPGGLHRLLDLLKSILGGTLIAVRDGNGHIIESGGPANGDSTALARMLSHAANALEPRPLHEHELREYNDRHESGIGAPLISAGQRVGGMVLLCGDRCAKVDDQLLTSAASLLAIALRLRKEGASRASFPFDYERELRNVVTHSGRVDQQEPVHVAVIDSENR